MDLGMGHGTSYAMTFADVVIEVIGTKYTGLSAGVCIEKARVGQQGAKPLHVVTADGRSSCLDKRDGLGMGSEPLCTVLHEETEIGWDKECSKAHVSTGKAGIEDMSGRIVECLIEAVDVLYTLYEYDGASTKEGWEYLAPVAEMGKFTANDKCGMLVVGM